MYINDKCTHYLEQCQVRHQYVIKVDFGVYPCIIFFQTFKFVFSDVYRQFVSVFIHAFVKLAGEELYPDDSKYQPENEAHHHDIGNGRNGFDQSIDDDLFGNNNALTQQSIHIKCQLYIHRNKCISRISIQFTYMKVCMSHKYN